MIDQAELLTQLTSGDDDRAETAARLLARAGEAALPRLIDLLESGDSDRRWWAVRTLAEMKEPRMDLLTQALRDRAMEVRAAAALAMAAHPSQATVPDLIHALGDADSLVSTLCVNALVSIGNACVPELLDAFPNSSQRGRIQIMRALAAIKDPRAIALMLKSTEDQSAMLNYWAHEGLESLGLSMVYLMPR